MIFLMGLIFVIAFILTLYYRKFALHHEIIDIPNARSSHKRPIPRGGGIVFVGIFYVLLIVLWLLHHIYTNIFLAFLGGIPIAVIGYLDDIHQVKIFWRFLIHIIAATWGIAMLGVLHPILLIILVLLTVWFVIFTILWMV